MVFMLSLVFQLGVRWVRQQKPLPYMVSQPLPWQVHYVSHSRKGSRSEEMNEKLGNMLNNHENNVTKNKYINNNNNNNNTLFVFMLISFLILM
uniref:Uncharacterized protein n=1 Tax=Sinocyclocheilus anshuiensis TaxID=1608454 RepID=A0A671KWB8_9TELE